MSSLLEDIKTNFEYIDKKKAFIRLVPYFLLAYFFNKMSELYFRLDVDNAFVRLFEMFNYFDRLFDSYVPSLKARDILIGITGAVIIYLIIYFRGKNAKKFRKGREYGSARWGKRKDIIPFMDKFFEDNIILTQTESLMMNSRPKIPKNARNKNILVIGGSGSGKTRFFVKPNLMQMHSSYVVTDPKGSILVECGKLLSKGSPKRRYDKKGKELKDKKGKPIYVKDKNGKIVYEPYVIKVLNTINFKKSMRYNPFAYLRSEKDILKLVNTIMVNTKGEGEKATEDFWSKAERLYYQALIGLIYYEAPVEEQNFTTLLELINMSETREDDENYKNAVDLEFEALAEKDPNHFAVRQYQKYKLAAGKTAKSILISCGARLAPFDIKEVRDLMETDELELDKIGDRKTALFVIISDTDTTFNFIVSMMYSQLFNLLCDKADDEYGGRLPIHTRLLLDEFANSVTRSALKTVGITNKSVA